MLVCKTVGRGVARVKQGSRDSESPGIPGFPEGSAHSAPGTGHPGGVVLGIHQDSLGITQELQGFLVPSFLCLDYFVLVLPWFLLLFLLILRSSEMESSEW